MTRRWLARRRFQCAWDATARDVRTSLAAATVELVDREIDRARADGRPVAGPVAAQIWGEMTDLLYPIKKES